MASSGEWEATVEDIFRGNRMCKQFQQPSRNSKQYTSYSSNSSKLVYTGDCIGDHYSGY